MRRFLLVIVALVLIVAGAAQWANSAWDRPGPSAPSGTQTVVLIAPHTSVHAVARMLAAKGVVESALLFEFDLRLHRLGGRIEAGEYAVPGRASMAALAAIMVSGKSILHKFTAAEGLTSAMIYKLVLADPLLSGQAGPQPAEGSLLPETYLFTRGTPRRQLLDRMAKAQTLFLAEHWRTRAPALPFAGIKDAVILASIVEKESALPEERRHIAAVFINRLKTGMKLQSDPTIIYGITKGYPLGRGIRQSEIEAATPYNTYVIAGLPPTPICNPGKDSLAAVLDPAISDDLYFVATGNGGHVFSSTIAEHTRNVAAYRAQERRKEAPDVRPTPRPAPPAVPAPHRKVTGPPPPV